MGYLQTLQTWAQGTSTMSVETATNDIAVFVTLRREDGLSATGYHATDWDEAAASAQRLYKATCKSH